MLERLLLPEKHAISILMKDHDTVKELFDRFEKSKSTAEKEKIVAEALTELKIHAVEEQAQDAEVNFGSYVDTNTRKVRERLLRAAADLTETEQDPEPMKARPARKGTPRQVP